MSFSDTMVRCRTCRKICTCIGTCTCGWVAGSGFGVPEGTFYCNDHEPHDKGK